MQTPSLTNTREKGFFWLLFFFFSHREAVSKIRWVKPGSSLHFSFGRCQRIMVPFPALHSAAKIAAFPADAHEVCAVDGDQPLPCHTHPISSAFAELKGKRRKFCQDF